MVSQHNVQKLRQEGRITLARQSIQNNQISSVRRAAVLYDVPQTSLVRRVNGTVPLTEFNAKKRKLRPSEEQALVEWALELNRRGFPPCIIDLR